MELWSLLHFLMPYVFRSRKEFSFWFANPMTGMVEGTRAHNDNVITRLHGIIRPFVLRRLKKDVESQMPGKYEHIVKCQLSRRQMFIYEEFMARSSTRQSLRKGGNFMDMMNVLMQLRKVCNHPDLFEPRPVLTPFIMEPLSLSLPSQVQDMVQGVGGERASLFLLSPIWSGSSGLPSTHSALAHDSLDCEALKRLRKTLINPAEDEDLLPVLPGSATASNDLTLLWLELEHQAQEEARQKLRKLSEINEERCCRTQFPYPRSLLNLISIEERSDVLSSPDSLLAMLRTQRQRASDVEELVKRFVFCVPKASARSLHLDAGLQHESFQKRKRIEEVLLEPLEELALPFQETDSRLSSCFPDKKLVQFDAGKLQVLAELLRELKRGGHRVLIFTQMSKMLDILEVSILLLLCRKPTPSLNPYHADISSP